MNQRLLPLIPEIALAAGAVLGLLAGSWLPRGRQWVVRGMAMAACVAGLAASGVAMTQSASVDFGSTFAIDVGTNVARIVVLGATLLVICLAVPAVGGHRRETEFYVLLQLAALGTVALAGADDLLTLFAAYLLASVPAYALAGFARDQLGTEAALKYYLVGALLGVVMLSGIALLYGAAGVSDYSRLPAALAPASHGVVAVGLVAVLAGLLFKVGAVPAHFWVPDVTDGSTIPVAAFVTTVPKIGGLVALARLLSVAIPAAVVDWPLLIALVAAASMTLGNLAAFFQTTVKRLLAYSTISQVGYMLMAVAVLPRSGIALRSLLAYLAAYAITNLGAFAVIAVLPDAPQLRDYGGMARRHPWLAAALVVCLLGLVGTPPTGVFLGKLEVFTAAIDGGLGWLAGLAVVNTVASLFYYLRWLAPTFLSAPADGEADRLRSAGRWPWVGAYSAGAASVALGVAGGVVLPLGAGSLLR